jgi:hypothetical protein
MSAVISHVVAAPQSSCGTKIISSTSLPSTVGVNQPFDWGLTGQVVNCNVTNPAVGLAYADGPADYITITIHGQTFQLARGMTAAFWISGSQPPGTTISESGTASLPVQGTYKLVYVAGWMENNTLYVTDSQEYTVTTTSPSPSAPTIPSLPSWAPLAIVIGIIGVGAIAVAGWMYQQQQQLLMALAARR